jgi:phosphomannomutase
MESLKSLQNGSDIRGIASPGVKGEEVNLTPEITEKLAKAFIIWLSEKEKIQPGELRIGVGTDSRISGPVLKQSIIKGVASFGLQVFDCGLATTPAMFMATQFDEIKCHGSIMITASHLPFNRNGFKFFTRQSGLEKDDVTRIIAIAESELPANQSDLCLIYSYNLIDKYSIFLCDFIRKHTGNEYPLKGKKIIVDAGNGAGGFFADKILGKLGADITGSQFLDPNGMFPNHISNPENEEAIGFLQRAVVNQKTDLGIIFDTDVDRAAIVDEKGKPINRNALIALLSAIILEEHPHSVIVTDSVTSNGLSSFITQKNGVHLRFKRGYRNVINKSIEINKDGKESWLAIETSGHAAFKENYFLDDGAFLVAKLLVTFARLAENGQTLGELIKDLKEPSISKEYRLILNHPDPKVYGTSIIEQLNDYAINVSGWQMVKTNFEGIRVQCNSQSGDGWFLLRLSLHEPLLALNIESDSQKGLFIILSLLRSFLQDFSLLDIKTMS